MMGERTLLRRVTDASCFSEVVVYPLSAHNGILKHEFPQSTNQNAPGPPDPRF